MKKYHLIKFFKFEYSFFDVIDYFRGNLRYSCYYSKHFKWLIRTHIHEQIDYRIKVMDEKCYNDGQCKICGCATTNLQMANKACEGNCYLPMQSKKEWRFIKSLIRMKTVMDGLNLKEANKLILQEYVEEHSN